MLGFTLQASRREIESAVEEAAGQLVSVRHVGHETFVQIPVFYPSGAGATVSVSWNGFAFFVSDYGIAYREAQMVGAEHLFARRARIVADALGLDTTTRIINISVGKHRLVSALSDVAAASTQVAHQIVNRVSGRGEREIAQHVLIRLMEIYGSANVEADAKLFGASTREWQVSARLGFEGQFYIFDAVANHHSSVYSTGGEIQRLVVVDKCTNGHGCCSPQIRYGKLVQYTRTSRECD